MKDFNSFKEFFKQIGGNMDSKFHKYFILVRSLVLIALIFLLAWRVTAFNPSEATETLIEGQASLNTTLHQIEDKEAIQRPLVVFEDHEEQERAIDSYEKGTREYTKEELDYMTKVIYQEAGSNRTSDETRFLVGYVVRNRMKHPKFPNTLYKVLTAKRQYGRFYKTGIVFPARVFKSDKEMEAVRRAKKIAEVVLSVEDDKIPIPSDVVFQAEFKQGSKLFKYIDGTYFCHL